MRYRSGGIALIVKNELIPFICVLKTESKLILWFSVSKSIMPNNEELLCGVLYLLPYGTKYAHADLYLELQNEFYKLFSNKYGGIFRTFITFHLEIYIPCAQFNNLCRRNSNPYIRNIIPCERFDNP